VNVRLAVFHNLPSGGGIRALSGMLRHITPHFETRAWFPSGSHPLVDPGTCSLRELPFPGGAPVRGIRRAGGTAMLIRRLGAFEEVCRAAAAEIDSFEPGRVLVNNSMYVAAPPILGMLGSSSVYFCFEYPRHIYEPELVSRTGHRLTEALLAPLVRIEKRIDHESAVSAGSVATLSDYMAGRIEAIYGRRARVARPGIDTTFFSPSGASGGGGYALSVGALWPFKGHEFCLRASAAAGVREVLITGDRAFPGYERRLVRVAAGLGTRLTIMAGVSDTELRELYRNASVVVCGQHSEPYGLVPLEAMSCGAPVVAVAEGGFPESIEDGVTGMLVPRDVGAAAAAIAGLAGDAVRRAALGRAAREFVRANRTVEQGAAALRSILESPPL
jgi:glycosyltransferase involved in cell wall biosynthesis